MSYRKAFLGVGMLAAISFLFLGGGCEIPSAQAVPEVQHVVAVGYEPEAEAIGPVVQRQHATLSRAEAFTLIAKSVVRVRVDRSEEKPKDGEKPKHGNAVGSGVVVYVAGMHGLIITAAHVVGDESGVLIDFDAEGEDMRTFPGVVEKVDKVHDLALIYAIGPVANHLTAAKVAKRDPRLYDELLTVANPLGVPRQTAIERINSMDGHLSKDQPIWVVTGMVVPGMSGGGVFTADGELECILLACGASGLGPETSFGYCAPRGAIVDLVKGYHL